MQTLVRMTISVKAAKLEDILPWRDMYRLEMARQIVHHSIHERRGWTDEYLLFVGDAAVGYGSIAVGGPWKGSPSLCEFYVVPHRRLQLFELFQALLETSGGKRRYSVPLQPTLWRHLYGNERAVSSSRARRIYRAGTETRML